MNVTEVTTQNFSNATIIDAIARHGGKINFLYAFHPAYVIIDRLITPFWLILGYVTNPLSALVWLNRRLRKNNSSAIYLASLSICDFIFLVLYLFYELTDSWGLNTYAHHGTCEFYHFLFYWPQYTSPVLVLAFTVERFIAVFFPFHKEKFCTVKRALIVTVSLSIFTMALSSVQPVFIIYNPVVIACTWRQDTGYNFQNTWNWTTEMLMFGIVPLAVLILNLLVLMVIKRLSRQSASMTPYQGTSNTTASTVTLLCVSFYLILTTLPVTAVFIVHHYVPMGNPYLTDVQIRSDPTWNRFFTFISVRKFIEEICLSHYCLYFFIYFGTGPQFRNILKKYIPIHSLCKKERHENGQYKSVATNGQSFTTTIM